MTLQQRNIIKALQPKPMANISSRIDNSQQNMWLSASHMQTG